MNSSINLLLLAVTTIISSITGHAYVIFVTYFILWVVFISKKEKVSLSGWWRSHTIFCLQIDFLFSKIRQTIVSVFLIVFRNLQTDLHDLQTDDINKNSYHKTFEIIFEFMKTFNFMRNQLFKLVNCWGKPAHSLVKT